MGNFFKALRIMNFVTEWSVRALEDGKVTMKELAELGAGICEILGVRAEFTVE